MISHDVVLQTELLAVGYRNGAVARDLDLVARRGEIVALLGRNGAGKTTTLHTIAGILPPLAGRVVIDGVAEDSPLHKRVRNGLALVTETRAIVRRLTVAQNLRLGPGDAELGLSIFPELRRLLGRKAGLLSGGEQQMLVLARVLAAKPRLLLVDELSFGLAPIIVRRLLEALRAAADTDGTAVILVEQHPTAALMISDRGYVLARGRIQLSEQADALMSRLGEIEEAYLSGHFTGAG